jgi:hypothetical protein
LLDGISIIKVKAALSFTLTIRRDDEVEGLGADFGRRERTLRTNGDDGAAADVQGDFCEIDVVERNLRTFAFDDLPSVEGIEAVVGEVDRDAGGVLFCDRGDEDVGAVEELQGVAEDVGVVGVGEE